MDINAVIELLLKQNREIIAFDETGIIALHYEYCPHCGSRNTLKVYEIFFATWSQVERSCHVCQYLERVVKKEPPQFKEKEGPDNGSP